MANEYKLSFTAQEIDKRLGDVPDIIQSLRNQENKNGSWTTRKPFITFTVDDGTSKDLTILKPIFQKYNVPCCPALICGDEWEVTNIEERLDLQNNHGWEHMCHGVNEVPFNNKTVEEVEAEILKSKAKLEELGFIINDIAYPSGSTTASDGTILYPLVKKYFRAGYGFNPHPTILPNTGILNSYNIKRVPLGSFTMPDAYNGKQPEYYKSLEYYKECVDYAVTNNAWCIFCLHSAATDFDETQQQHLDDLIAYIQSIGVDIGNLTEGYEMFGNYVECGDLENGFRVTNSGENNLPAHYLKSFNAKSTTPITDFPLNKVSIVETGHSDNTSGFPDNTVGTLLTSRFEHFGFQIWFANANNNIYKRIWNGSNWGAFQTINKEPASDGMFSKLFQLGKGTGDNFAVKFTNRLFIRTFYLTNGTTATLNQQYFAKSAIATSKSNPTVIGTTSDGAEIQMYYQSGGWLCFKLGYEDEAQLPTSVSAYIEIAYS